MRRLALLAGLLFSALPASATNWTEIQRVESVIERLGARVYWMRVNTGPCARRGVLGLYMFAPRTVYMCQQTIARSGEPIIHTLQHEGWHAAQHLCNNNQPILPWSKVNALLTNDDRQNLRLYPDNQLALESEARALERIPAQAWINGFYHYCS